MSKLSSSVLVVDDHMENQIALKRILDSINISYDCADNGEDALEYMESKEYAVVLMDIQMPGKSGFDVVNQMHENKDYHDSPIIFITGTEESPESTKKGYEYGASDYLIKPVNPVAISQKVQTFCELFELKKKKENSQEIERNILLAKISHEIRTPMNGIIGNLQQLEGSLKLTDEQLKFVEGMKTSSDQLLNVVDKMIEYSNLQQGKTKVEKSVINVKETVGSVLKSLELEALESNNHLSLEILKDVPNYVKIDGVKVSHILHNIVENSLKFSDNGIVKLLVSNQQGHDKNRLFFEVRDTGVGMGSESKINLFKGFNQEQYENSSLKRGAGLGLSISKGLIDMLEGDIYFTSEHGVGTTFYFSVAYDLVSNEETPNVRGVNIDGCKFDIDVLVVEDQVVNQKVAKMMLEQYGCRVETALNGVGALQKINGKQFDLILMDIEMPVMDGFETIKNLKENYSNCPKIYAVTANCLRSDQEGYKNAGFNAFMLKPLKKIDLVSYLFKDFPHRIIKD